MAREEAHQMLVEIYDWFTEGFDTVDLKEAKVLLEELAGILSTARIVGYCSFALLRGDKKRAALTG